MPHWHIVIQQDFKDINTNCTIKSKSKHNPHVGIRSYPPIHHNGLPQVTYLFYAWKQELIVLLPKIAHKSPKIEAGIWYQFSCATRCLWAHSITSYALDPQHNMLSSWQEGLFPWNCLQEHIFCLQPVLRDSLLTSSKQFIAFQEIKATFRSLNHTFTFRPLDQSEGEIASYAHHCLKLNSSSTRSIFFTLK